MKKTENTTTVRVKMRGNHKEWENGQEYDLPVDIANELTGLGLALLIDSSPVSEERTEEVL